MPDLPSSHGLRSGVLPSSDPPGDGSAVPSMAPRGQGALKGILAVRRYGGHEPYNSSDQKNDLHL